jgi:ABC-type glycerol-3-phosphate transport system permease component
LLHLAVIAGGPEWYRFFGAGEEMAAAAERGSAVPAVVTLGIAALLSVWAAYAFSGAGLLRRLPLMRTALVLISTVYLARGLILVPMLLLYPHSRGIIGSFEIWSSLIVLAYGIAYAVGTWQGWDQLSSKKVSHALGS